MRFVAILSIALSALFAVAAVALASGSATIQTTAGGPCPATMVWDGQHCA